MIAIPRPLRLTFYSLLIIAGAVLAAALATRHAERQALVDDAARANQQLALYANSLHTLIERYRALPAVLALDSEMISALKSPLDAATQDLLNRKLERINNAAQSSTLELMDRTGLAVAASNWKLPSSYVGHNYAFRPYFRQTLSQGTGRFYAVGVTTGVPGYFLSSAVLDEHEQFLGAMVVKLEFPELEREWAQGNDLLLVSDARGIVFIANQPGWRYRNLRPLSASDLAELTATRQYDKKQLQSLETQTLQRFDENSHLMRVNGPDGNARYIWGIPAAEGRRLDLAPAAQTPVRLRRPTQRRPRRRRFMAGAGVPGAVPDPALAPGPYAPAQPRRARTACRGAHPGPAHGPGWFGAIGQAGGAGADVRRPRP